MNIWIDFEDDEKIGCYPVIGFTYRERFLGDKYDFVIETGGEYTHSQVIRDGISLRECKELYEDLRLMLLDNKTHILNSEGKEIK
jgi:hypothetical protein